MTVRLKKIAVVVSMLFLSGALGGVLHAQAPAFTFECFCGYLTEADSNCDICTTSLQSRMFKGLLIYKDSVAYRWIEQPYTILQNYEALTFKELIPGAEQIRIELYGTPYDSIQQFRDSVLCPCAGGGTPTVFIAGPGIVISGDTISAVDTSASNEAWTVSDQTDYELMTNDTLFFVGAGQTTVDFDSVANTVTITTPAADGSETIVTAGTGISVSGSGTVGDPYVITNTGDLSSTNEIQTLSASGAGPTSYDIDLSLGGGSVTLSEGVYIDITRSGNTITIAGTAALGLNGIYGDGTPGSGSDTLPAGGSTVQIPGAWQPLNFNITTFPGAQTALQVTADDCDDVIQNKYLVGKSPQDSLEIMGYDCGSIIKASSGFLSLESTEYVVISGDSIYITNVPTKTTLPYMLGQSNLNVVSKIVGSSSGDVLKWNTGSGGYWEVGAGSGGGPTGSGTANRLAYWSGTTTLAADDDAAFDGSKVGFGTTTLTARANINDGTTFAPFALNAYGTSTSGGLVYAQISDLRSAGQTFLSFNDAATLTGIEAGIRHYNSAHASFPGQLDVMTNGSDPVSISTNNTTRLTVTGTGIVHAASTIAAGYSTTTGIHSTLQTAGSFSGPVTQGSGNVTLGASDYVRYHVLNSTVSYTLPDPTTCNGRQYIIHHFGSSGTIGLNYSVISSTGTTFNSISARQWAHIFSDGTNWIGYKLQSL